MRGFSQDRPPAGEHCGGDMPPVPPGSSTRPVFRSAPERVSSSAWTCAGVSCRPYAAVAALHSSRASICLACVRAPPSVNSVNPRSNAMARPPPENHAEPFPALRSYYILYHILVFFAMCSGETAAKGGAGKTKRPPAEPEICPSKKRGVFYILALWFAKFKGNFPNFSISAQGMKTGTFLANILE